MSENGISVVIPSWNGRGLLEQCLPTVRAALDRWGGESEVIVVDDCGKDGTPGFLAEKFPWARVERMERRRGFSHAANRGVRAARHGFVCMLNNDMEVEPDFFAPLVERMKDPRVFAVSARAVQIGTGKINIGRRVRRIESNNVIGIGEELDDPETGYTLYASGGASLFRKNAMMELGCFDEMYAPFYIEDSDLSYRAWKRGRVVLYEPRALVRHIGGASITRKGAPPHIWLINRLRIGAITQRNILLFYIKNYTEPALWAAHKRKIILTAVAAVFRLKVTYLLGLAAALPRMSAAFAARRTEALESSVSDYQVYAKLCERYTPEK